MLLFIRYLLAVVGPAAVIGGALAWYVQAEPWEASKQVKLLDEAVAPADVVILGSSWAETNVDDDELARGLGVPRPRVITLSQPKSYPAVWYAIARYRLYAREDIRPKVVMLVTSIQALMLTRPDPKELGALEQHYEAPDRVLLARAYGIQSAPWLARVLSRRAEPRDAVVSLAKASLVSALVPPGQTTTDIQTAAAHSVFAEVEGNGDAQLARFLPVVEKNETPAAGVGGAFETRVEDTLLGDLAALVEEHGAHLVVVVPPVASFQRSRQMLAPALERELVEFVNAHQVGWLDLRGQQLDDRSFRADGGHMTAAGARPFTTVLAAELKRIGALDAGPPVPATAQARIEAVKRLGEPPALQAGPSKALADKCLWTVDLSSVAALSPTAVRDTVGVLSSPVQALLGDAALPFVPPPRLRTGDCEPGWMLAGKLSRIVLPEGTTASAVRYRLNPALPDPDARQDAVWWVYSGTGIQWSIEDTGGAGEVSVEVTARPATAETGAVELVVGDRVVPLVAADDGLSARVSLSLPAGPRVFTLRSAADGPHLAIRKLVIEQPGSKTELVRPPPQKVADALSGELAFGPPPSVDAKLGRGAKGPAFYTVPWTNELLCTPFRVTEDGVALPMTDGEKKVVVNHRDDKVYVRPPDKVDPLVDPARFDLVLDAARSCDVQACNGCPKRVWLYPGDHLRTELGKEGRRKVGAPVRVLHVAGESMPPAVGDATLTVRATWHDAVVVERVATLNEVAAGLSLPVSAPIPLGDAAALTIEIELSANASPTRVSVRAMSL